MGCVLLDSKCLWLISGCGTFGGILRNIEDVSDVIDCLGGGNSKSFYFQPIFGEDEPILSNIFQRGWNHQLVVIVDGEKLVDEHFIEYLLNR